MNRHFEIASFLLENGANINTDWATHEPASILHERAVNGNYEGADSRSITASTPPSAPTAAALPPKAASHAAKDEKMAELLARAERARKARSL